MKKIYIYGENKVTVTIMRDCVKELLSGPPYNELEADFCYAGVIHDAGILLNRIQNSVYSPVVLLNIQPRENIILLQAIREIREAVGIAVFCKNIFYSDKIVSGWFNTTLLLDTDLADASMSRYIRLAMIKSQLKYRKITECKHKENLVAELIKKLPETMSQLDYILHISLLSEPLTRKERAMVSYLREGMSVEQVAVLTGSNVNRVNMCFRGLCDKLQTRKQAEENFTLSEQMQCNSFKNN
ncbi:TPA: helix-turn-helix transcriptional regulator [Salmonella enterica]